MSDRIKVNFPLEQDDEGYPPFASEGLWAEPLKGGRFRIDSIPFYVHDLSAEDIVEAAPGPDGGLAYLQTIERSANSTVRVILYEEGARDPLLSRLRDLGCDFEVGAPDKLIAVNVPPTANVQRLLALLGDEVSAERIDYEESAPRYLASRE